MKYGPYGELFFFLKTKGTGSHQEMVNLGHCFPVEAIKACAMCGSHMFSEETDSLSNSVSSQEQKLAAYQGSESRCSRAVVEGAVGRSAEDGVS